MVHDVFNQAFFIQVGDECHCRYQKQPETGYFCNVVSQAFVDECCGRFGDDFPITEVNRIYVKLGKAKLVNIGKETWVDCGTPDSLLQASIMAKEGKLNPNPHR